MKNARSLTRVTGKTHMFLDRELSQLTFNRRVLAQAEDPSIPLLERLRYLCIVSNNLDEFFEVRVASLLASGDTADNPALAATLERISAECHELVRRQYQILNKDVLPHLAAEGIHLLRHADRNEAQRAWVKDYFEREVRPLLTPIALDPSHPFPQVINKSLNFIVSLTGKDAFGRGTAVTIVKAPRVLPRVIELPKGLSRGEGVCVCLLSSVIHAHIEDLFPGREIIAFSQFRVTRDSDLWVDEDEVKNLRQALKGELQGRQFGRSVRLEVAESCPPELSDFLLNQFELDKSRLYAVDGPVNMVRLNELLTIVNRPALRFPPFIPGAAARTAQHELFEELQNHDVLLHHPYQSFQMVVDFIQMAARDPQVVAIKQTIYRTGMHSELMEALLVAARSGKEVTVVLELMARFDEEANINWADKLEKAGAQVVYGVVGLKTHAKLAMVIRREETGLCFYAHLGTGNYHLTTTKFYTDFGLLTARQDIAREVNDVFLHLTSLAKPQRFNHLWLAPFTLQNEVIRAIRNEARIAKAGRPGRIIAKMNALVDESVIRALYSAAQDGVKIDLIVRGACTLRPGVPGLSENIRVRSIIGRFLEHSRIYYFRNNGDHEVLLGSADLMERNLDRRVEVIFPVEDPALAGQIRKVILPAFLRDTVNARELRPDGSYRRLVPADGAAPFDVQSAFLAMYRSQRDRQGLAAVSA
jgi:polyphosphate kinase